MKNTLIQSELFNPGDTTIQTGISENYHKISSPFPMQYLGGKGRISNWIIQNIKEFFPACNNFLDLFAGTGIVSLHAQRAGYDITLNDYEPYSYALLKGIFGSTNAGLEVAFDTLSKIDNTKFLLKNGREFLHSDLKKEERFFSVAATQTFQWKEYQEFCQKTPIIKGNKDEVLRLRKEKKWNLFSQYYANTYFGIRQCLELDSIREIAEKYPIAKPYLLAAAISAMTYGVSSTTHLAQYLRPQSLATTHHLIKRRKFNFITAVKQRLTAFSEHKTLEPNKIAVYQHDFREMLNMAPLNSRWVIYADPPYFKEHYSRYYHVLNTFCLYDFPFLTYNNQFKGTTEGRYREGRNVSDFGKKSLVKNAFHDLLAKCAEMNCKLALSYAETSLVKKDEILNIAKKLNLRTEIIETELTHSSQGQAGRTKRVCEYLFLIQ